jgi:lambda repressor-like predicted transcriptional regulator
VGVYLTRRADALSDPATLTPLTRARLTYGPNRDGMTCRALAVKAGLSEATVWRAETTGRVSPRTWRKLARALGTSVAEIKP